MPTILDSDFPEHVITTLGHTKGVNDWQARHIRELSTQLYLIGNRPEAVRTVQQAYTRAQVYNDHPFPGLEPSDSQIDSNRRGSSSFILLPADSQGERLKAKLSEAVFMAGLSHNLPYSLPEPATYPEVELVDQAITTDPRAALERLRNQIEAALAREPGVRLGSAELFTTFSTHAFANSRGIRAGLALTECLIDLVLLSTAGGGESEYHVALRRRRLADVSIEELIQRYAGAARDSLQAQTPPTGRGAVLISGEAVTDFFGPLRYHASARSAYQQVSRFIQGRSIFGDSEPTGDPLTMASNSLLPYGVRSSPFDSEGLAGRRTVFIERGTLVARVAGQKYADYLRIPPTGEGANLEVSLGSFSLPDLLAGAPESSMQSIPPLHYHLVAFSWMQPDLLTGDFTGEIKLGYSHDGHAWKPIKGGSLSGNIFTAFAGARLSREQQFTGDYVGPQAILFPDLAVTGN